VGVHLRHIGGQQVGDRTGRPPMRIDPAWEEIFTRRERCGK
jgi:hypothetical protein